MTRKGHILEMLGKKNQQVLDIAWSEDLERHQSQRWHQVMGLGDREDVGVVHGDSEGLGGCDKIKISVLVMFCLIW